MSGSIPARPPLGAASAWRQLQARADAVTTAHLADLFRSDPRRADAMTFVPVKGLRVDLSKQRLDAGVLQSLLALAEEQDVSGWRDVLFAGGVVNPSENRSAQHWRLRQQGDGVLDDAVAEQLARMAAMVGKLQSGQWRGFDGDIIQDVVVLGVGGSELGPLMASEALSDVTPASGHPLRLHFVSSLDGGQISRLLDRLNPRETLFVVSSKSFTTVDTLTNAATARAWLGAACGDRQQLMRCHFIGISAQPDRMAQWGIPTHNQLMLWDWVGGRFSVWSAIGLPIALRCGMPAFLDMLAGAREMDGHFRDAPAAANVPLLMALVDVWNINFLGIRARSILPYDSRLKELPAYLEQLEMESNGKSVTVSGQPLDYQTCSVIWGAVGSNAQHAFYQLLHQGTQTIACDFVLVARRRLSELNGDSQAELRRQHQINLANGLAQSRLLALGDAAMAEPEQGPAHVRYRGNQPSTTVLLDELDARSLGAMLALYEHKVFCCAAIWQINPFDQWGVEQGKVMAEQTLTMLAEGGYGDVPAWDSSTRALIDYVRGQDNGDS